MHGDKEQTFAQSHELVELPGTPPGEETGKIFDMGCSFPEDFEDVDLTNNIVLASSLTPDDHGRGIHRSEKYHYAESGATAFIFYNYTEGALPPTGNIGSVSSPETYHQALFTGSLWGLQALKPRHLGGGGYTAIFGTKR
ncbi:hypothetical protein [Haladaptatus sp. DFWS20]|uniref:hypothetical protein n=1 Tax=Haladaptatus sp. DFWS20 TaxID=3403467 RepID=UPI003EBDFA75